MSRTTSVRKYGKTTRKPREAEALFAQLPGTPVKSEPKPEQRPVLGPQLSLATVPADEVSDLIQQLTTISVYDTTPAKNTIEPRIPQRHRSQEKLTNARSETPQNAPLEETDPQSHHEHDQQEPGAEGESVYDSLRVLTWDDVCPAGDGIEKIAEASFAEVYRITNAHGTSIIKVIRLESPIKPQTKAQERSGLVDEEPHSEEDMQGELRISEWLADVPGFVVYKERYVVKGKATKALLETHQAFHRRMKRQDPDRLQFYPSPSRYLDDTRFLVVELGDAGTALEDFELTSISQVRDIFLHTALALARAEDLIEFEHRDLHEGNLCIRKVRPPKPRPNDNDNNTTQFGFSGLDITILDYGLSRATDPETTLPSSPPSHDSPPTPSRTTPAAVVAPDLEKDLTLFQSTHAPQCRVYRQMRSFLIHADRFPQLPASKHTTPYPRSAATGEPISWREYNPYSNVLWLAYLYGYLVVNFKGDRAEMSWFKRETRELRMHLDPCAHRDVLSFASAGEVVRFAVEAGWVAEGQVVDCWGEEGSMVEGGGCEGREEGKEEDDGERDGGDCDDGEGGKVGGERVVEAVRNGGEELQNPRPQRKTRRRNDVC